MIYEGHILYMIPKADTLMADIKFKWWLDFLRIRDTLFWIKQSTIYWIFLWSHTRAALPPLEPPVLLVTSWGFRVGPVLLVKLLPLKHMNSQLAFPFILPPKVKKLMRITIIIILYVLFENTYTIHVFLHTRQGFTRFSPVLDISVLYLEV